MAYAKSVLVTGATGFLGRATVAALEASGWSVICGVRKSSSLRKNGTVLIDLARPETVLELQSSLRVDAIVHLGAHVDLSATSERGLFVPNVISTGLIAHLSHVCGAHLVYASTAIVCGVREAAINSSSPINPDTAYAKSKWQGERLIGNIEANHCTLRLSGVYGLGGPEHLGINRAIDMARLGHAPQLVGSGRALRNYIYVKDVAIAICHILTHKVMGVHFLAGGEQISIYQMLKTICDVFMPGTVPSVKDGAEAMSQIVEPSPDMPTTRTFRAAIEDIARIAS